MKVHIIFLRTISVLLLLAATGGVYHIYAKESEETIWKIKENLTFRLGSEWYKIGILTRECSSLSDVLSEIKDLELYPTRLTGFVESELVQLDKKIEKIEKENSELQKRINVLKGPLSDAISILRELVGGEFIESMFEVLEKGDLNRINVMLSIKHDIDKLWKQSDSLFDYISKKVGLQSQTSNEDSHFDEEFFNILKTNLGQTSQNYYKKLNLLKAYMFNKATTSEIEEIYKIERYKILEHLKNDNRRIAYQKISDLIQHLEGKRSCDEMYLLKARIELLEGNYNQVLEIVSNISETGDTHNLIFLYKMQSYYALKQYYNILSETEAIDISTFTGSSRNMLLWIIIESSLERRDVEVPVSSLVTYVTKNSSYALHTIHAFARTLLVKNDTSTAISALESTRSYPVNSNEDKIARQQIELTIADIYYESGNYESALTQYYSILQTESMYANALFGILWCYIKTGQISKSETALRKLINQAPESPLAAESILILAKRYLDKANSSWKKRTYLENEEIRLNQMLEKLNTLALTDTSVNKSTQYQIAKKELNTLSKRIHSEPRVTYNQIVEYYNQIQNVCDLVAHYYHSGTFQETSFSEQRESLLMYLDSVLIQINNSGLRLKSERKLSNASNNRIQIKKIVDNGAIFSSEALIDKYRWEREYIDNEKSNISKSIHEISAQSKSQTDSLLLVVYAQTKDSLSNEMNAYLKKEESIHEMYFNELTRKLSILVEADINHENRMYFTYQLGELHYAHENREYSNKYDFYELTYSNYESKLKDFRSGSLDIIPPEPSPPRLNHDTSMSYYMEIINSKEPSLFTHAAHYSLAWCYIDLSMSDSSHYHMEIVATQYPLSIHNAQAWMYCGEYYFDKGMLDKAITCYHAVMRFPESDWFDEALYKQAWAQYRLSNPEKAISSFLALVDLGEGSSAGKSLLEKESMDYIAISFSETDPTGPKGLDRALAFTKKLGDLNRGCTILQRLASVYKEQGRYDMAKKTLQTILSTYPYYSRNPQIEYDLISLLERDESPMDLNTKKTDFFKKYSKLSEWSSSQIDTLAITIADSLSERMLYGAAIGYHQLALQKNSSALYTTALNTYRDYINTYSKSPSANECHYNYAEIHFSLGNYQEAAEEYIAVSRRYPDSKYKETAAWNAIVASQNSLKQESNTR